MEAAEKQDLVALRAWQNGDAAAGNSLVRRYLRLLYRFFRAHSDGDVSDLVQQTFLACVREQPEMPDDATFRLVLLRLAKEQLMASRRLARRVQNPEPLPTSPQIPGILSPSADFASRDLRRRLMRSLRRLPLELQTVLVLHYWEGCTVRELAVILSIPPGTVKSRLFRARQCLKESFGEVSGQPSSHMTTLRQIDQWAREVAANSGGGSIRG